MKLALGKLVATRGVFNGIGVTEEVLACLARHQNGDWGDLDEEDKETNNKALKLEGRILSAYTVHDTKIWIITEWDRSVTTILLPEEY